MKETISLHEILETIKKRLLLIAIMTLTTTLASGLVSYLILKPTYQSSTQMLVNQSTNNGSNVIDSTQIQTNIQLINTYSVIIKSPTILNDVSNQVGKKVVDKDVTVNSAQDSQVFTVTVQDPDPSMAAKIANTIASVFQAQIQTIMKVDNVSVLSKAQLPPHPKPVNPKPLLNMTIAFVVGLMLSMGIAFLLDYLDKTIKAEQDIEQFLGIPILGVVTEMGLDEIRHLEKLRIKRVSSEAYET